MSRTSTQELLRVLIAVGNADDRAAIRQYLTVPGRHVLLTDIEPHLDVIDAARAGEHDAVVIDGRPGDTEPPATLCAAGIRAAVLCVAASDDDATAVALLAAGATDVLARADLASPTLGRRVLLAIRASRAERRAEQSVRRGEDMLALVSHDLRGPLSSIHVAADGLREVDVGAPERTRYLDAIQRSVQRADRLIRDLLDASLMDAGKFTVERRPIRVRELLEQSARDHERVATQAKSQVVVIAIPDGIDRIEADRDRLLQALAHLIQNSLRHGRPTPQVELSATATAEGVELAVRDHGPGMPAETALHGFERYWEGRPRRGGGGLGLPIVKGIVTAHGGSVTAGAAPGGGTRVAMVFPAR